jgi:hypothetical protein
MKQLLATAVVALLTFTLLVGFAVHEGALDDPPAFYIYKDQFKCRNPAIAAALETDAAAAGDPTRVRAMMRMVRAIAAAR